MLPLAADGKRGGLCWGRDPSHMGARGWGEARWGDLGKMRGRELGIAPGQASLAEAASAPVQVRALLQWPAVRHHQNEQQALVPAPRDHARHPQLRV